MWQILLGIYIIFGVLGAIVLWSSLVVAKRSDRGPERRSQPMADLTMSEKSSLIDNEIFELPTPSHLSEI